VGQPDMPLISIVRAPTVEKMVAEIELGGERISNGAIALQSGGARLPLFFVHGLDGDVVGFTALARRLGPDQSFYGLRARGLDGEGAPPDRIEELASEYLPDIRRAQPHGPYVLGGFCMGAGVAVELAQRLTAAGDRVALLVLVDPRIGPGRQSEQRRARFGWRHAVSAARSRLSRKRDAETPSRPTGSPAGIARQLEPLARARDAYCAHPVDIPTAVFLSPDHRGGALSEDERVVLRNVVSCVQVEGSHGRRFHIGAVEELASAMRSVLGDLEVRESAT
jgi:thioesterase domain-containing protein